jgi:hypothetical protein
MIVDNRLKLTVTKFTLLEELELCTGTCEAVGTACPLLKRLRLNSKQFFKWYTENVEREAMGIATMRRPAPLAPALREASQSQQPRYILDGCARLESLDVHHCFSVAMGGDTTRTPEYVHWDELVCFGE